MQKLITSENIKYGMKVVRGPGWIFNLQDEGAVCGVVIGLSKRGGVVTSCGIVWIDEQGDTTNSNTYPIRRDGLEMSVFLEYDGEASNTEKEGELVANLTNDAKETWNNAIELCIDLAYQHLNITSRVNKFIEELESFKKEVGVVCVAEN